MTTRTAAARPLTPAQQLAQTRQQAELTRIGVVAGILLLLGQTLVPSPLGGVDWRAAIWSVIGPPLMQPVPPPTLATGMPSFPLLQWLIWLVVLVLVLFVWQLLLHLLALARQRTVPLGVPRTVLRLRVPTSETLTADDALALLRTLHGIVPSVSLVRGGATPLILRWTGRPESPVLQTVSVPSRPDLVMSVQKVLEGLARGTRAESVDDPLDALITPGTVLAWADARLTAANDLPIAPLPSTGNGAVLDALLPALAPQTGVRGCELQVLAAPIADRSWRAPVVARLDSLKADADSSEKQAMQRKAQGPAYTVTIRALALAQDAPSAAAQVQTIGAALAGSAQSAGMQQQRLLLGPIQTLPAVLPPPTPLPTRPLALLAGGGMLLGGSALVLWPVLPLMLAAPLMGLLPALIVGTLLARRSGADAAETLRAVRRGRLPLRNPNLVMLISPWLGRND